jgi:hypothetical protein
VEEVWSGRVCCDGARVVVGGAVSLTIHATAENPSGAFLSTTEVLYFLQDTTTSFA